MLTHNFVSRQILIRRARVYFGGVFILFFIQLCLRALLVLASAESVILTLGSNDLKNSFFIRFFCTTHKLLRLSVCLSVSVQELKVYALLRSAFRKLIVESGRLHNIGAEKQKARSLCHRVHIRDSKNPGGTPRKIW